MIESTSHFLIGPSPSPSLLMMGRSVGQNNNNNNNNNKIKRRPWERGCAWCLVTKSTSRESRKTKKSILSPRLKFCNETISLFQSVESLVTYKLNLQSDPFFFTFSKSWVGRAMGNEAFYGDGLMGFYQLLERLSLLCRRSFGSSRNLSSFVGEEDCVTKIAWQAKRTLRRNDLSEEN